MKRKSAAQESDRTHENNERCTREYNHTLQGKALHKRVTARTKIVSTAQARQKRRPTTMSSVKEIQRSYDKKVSAYDYSVSKNITDARSAEANVQMTLPSAIVLPMAEDIFADD